MHRIVLLLADLCLIAIATLFAVVLRHNLALPLDRLYGLLTYVGATLVAAVVILPVLGLNRAVWRFSSLSDCLRVVQAAIFVVLGAVGIGFAVNRLDGIARALPILQGILIVAALVSVRVMMRLRHDIRKSKSARQLNDTTNLETTETVLVIGLNKVAELFLQSLAEFAKGRIRVAGLLGCRDRQTGRVLRQYEILGTADQLESVLKDLEVHGVFIDRIVVTQAFDALSPQVQHAVLGAEWASNIRVDFFGEHIGIHGDADRPGTTPKEQHLATNNGHLLPITVDLKPSLSRPYWLVKRVIDLVGAACLLVLLAPVMGLIAIVVALDIGIPTVFWQQRPGLAGRSFKLLKFRTMGAAHDSLGHRVQDDQRLSVVGRFLRRTRLDELPQLFNILVGDMSFMGPRPLLPVDQSAEHNYRLFARPGLTGWAQINGGRNLSAEDKSALDVWYIKNASLALDLKIVWLTFATHIGGERPNGPAVHQAWQELGDASRAEASDAEKPVALRRQAVA